MRVADLSQEQFARRLAGPGLGVRLGPYDVRIVADLPEIASPLQALYAHYPLLTGDRVYGIHVALQPVWQWRPHPSQQVRLLVDGRAPHADMPRAQALCVLEWGINLVIALRYHALFMLHAAVVERGGRALLLPAAPGAGKTTLCAALIHNGWRLLSDEFGLLRPGTTELLPLPRPLPLKNESTAIVRAIAGDAHFGPLIAGTRKGDITHLRPPRASIERMAEPATARWLVFPQWRAGSALTLTDMPAMQAFSALAGNAFNYELLGEAGFTSVGTMVAATSARRLVYSDLRQAIEALGAMADGDGR